MKLFSIIAGAFFALASSQAFADYQNTFRCESTESATYNTCHAGGTIRQAYVLYKVPNTSCNSGTDWGVSGEYIWVNNGCRGDFVVTVAGNNYPDPGHPGYPGYPGDPGYPGYPSYEYRWVRYNGRIACGEFRYGRFARLAPHNYCRY